MRSKQEEALTDRDLEDFCSFGKHISSRPPSDIISHEVNYTRLAIRHQSSALKCSIKDFMLHIPVNISDAHSKDSGLSTLHIHPHVGLQDLELFRPGSGCATCQKCLAQCIDVAIGCMGLISLNLQKALERCITLAMDWVNAEETTMPFLNTSGGSLGHPPPCSLQPCLMSTGMGRKQQDATMDHV